MKDEEEPIAFFSSFILPPSSFFKNGGSNMPPELRTRTKQYALRIIRVFCALPKTTEAQVLGRQMLKSGTSVGAHYREGHRARSNAEFISKLEGGLQELDETGYWLELLIESGIIAEARLGDLIKETNELIAILVTCVKRAKDS